MKRRDIALAGIVLIMFWQFVALLVDEPILPGPVRVGQVFVNEMGGGLPSHFLVSTWRVLASILLSILLAAPAGLILGQSEKIDRIFAPFVYMLYPIPKVVLVPIVTRAVA